MEKKTDLRILKTQKALCDTFMVLCSKKNFEDITVGELCDKALVRRATFYKHFSDKYDFFAFFIRYTQNQFIADYEENKNHQSDAKDQSDDFYTYLFDSCCSFLMDHLNMVQNITGSSAFSTLIDILTDEVSRNIYMHLKDYADENNKQTIDSKILAYFFAGGAVNIYRYWLKDYKNISKEDIYDAYKELVKLCGLY